MATNSGSGDTFDGARTRKVRLSPMSETLFQAYLATAVQEYAQGHLKSGDCEPEDALMLAQKDYQELLPNGLQTKNHFLFSIYDDASDAAESIGMVWFAVKDQRAVKSTFIYDFSIREDLRGHGYGRATLGKVEELIRQMGIGKVFLHVFGYNHAARALYEKMGYQITGIGMTKSLDKR